MAAKRKTGIRMLVTWCVYVPASGNVLGWHATEKEAKKLFCSTGAVIVKMKGTYIVPREDSPR